MRMTPKEIFIPVFDERRYAEGPDVLRFGAKGMIVYCVWRSQPEKAHFDTSSSTGFPVSKTVDKRLLANTSGITSTNM